MFGVGRDSSVNVETMHFTRGAVRWVENTNSWLLSFTWEEFCEAVTEKFGREEFSQTLR